MKKKIALLTILETYCDADGNPSVENCQKDDILVPHPEEWIEGDYQLDENGGLNLILDKQ